MLARTGPRGRVATRPLVVDDRADDPGSGSGRSGTALRGAGGRGTGPDRSGSSLGYASRAGPSDSIVLGVLADPAANRFALLSMAPVGALLSRFSRFSRFSRESMPVVGAPDGSGNRR
jgi:hypothetical protein